MNLMKPARTLLLHVKSNCVQQTNKRGFLYSWKKGLSRDTLAWLQQPLDLTLTGIRRWLQKKQWQTLVDDHRYIPERHQILGPDLATAHFVVARNGAVKFEDMDRWIKKHANGKYYLPPSAQGNMRLEAVDASGTTLMYNSFDNFYNLRTLKYLNVSKCPYIDDWCLDRFVQFRDTLMVLNLSGCPAVTERGLASLHKLSNLKRLYLHDMPNVQNPDIVGIMLEEAMPNCVIEGINYTQSADSRSATDVNMNSFLSQWQQFALHKDHERQLAAERDGISDVTQTVPEKSSVKT